MYSDRQADKRLVDGRLNRAKVIQSCDVLVTTDGIVYTTDFNGGMYILEYQGDPCAARPNGFANGGIATNMTGRRFDFGSPPPRHRLDLFDLGATLFVCRLGEVIQMHLGTSCSCVVPCRERDTPLFGDHEGVMSEHAVGLI
jgi:hypothetical protein